MKQIKSSILYYRVNKMWTLSEIITSHNLQMHPVGASTALHASYRFQLHFN